LQILESASVTSVTDATSRTNNRTPISRHAIRAAVTSGG